MQTWPRVIFAQSEMLQPAKTADYVLRRLEAADRNYLAGLHPKSTWISKTWGGYEGLAASGYAWGAFVNGQLASIACTFYLGETFEEIGVVTEPEYQLGFAHQRDDVLYVVDIPIPE